MTAPLLLGLFMAGTAGGPPPRPGVIGLPGQGFALVEEPRTLRESWGSITVRLEVAGCSATAPVALTSMGAATPLVRARSFAGPCELVTTLFRAPTDPDAADVIRAEVANRSTSPAAAQLVLSPAASAPDLTLSPQALTTRDRRLIALPAYARPSLPMHDWGLVSNAAALPGWAHPSEPCDPAFRNIRVGWRGEPITYRFKVEPKGTRLVMLGLCESHWAEGGKRPLLLQVEGAPDWRVDPVADWGRHVPRCVPFQATDVNGDGRLTVTSIATADAFDQNSILNAIWVFPAGSAEDPAAVARGERSDRAQYYVAAGGDRDQSLYTVGDVVYPLSLQPGETQALTFLLAWGGGAPAPPETTSQADRYLAEAERLWSDELAGGASVHLPAPGADAVWTASLQAILMARGQASKYALALPTPDAGSFSYEDAALIARALDLSGHPKEAAECLAMLWDEPLPDSLAQWGQADDGAWRGTRADWGNQGQALFALASHYLLTGDRAWLAQAYPSVRRGAEWLAKAVSAGRAPSPSARQLYLDALWALAGLQGAAMVASDSERPEDARWMADAATRLQRDLPAALAAAARREGREPSPSERVPFDHWAYDAATLLIDGGIVTPIGTHEFRADPASTRRDFAVLLARSLLMPEPVPPTDPRLIAPRTQQLCARLVAEFAAEIAQLDPAQPLLLPRETAAPVRPGLETGLGASVTRLLGGASCQGFLADPEKPARFPDAAEAARFITFARAALLDDADVEQLRLLAGVPAAWLRGERAVAADRLPSRFGPVSLRARLVGGALRLAITPPPRLPRFLCLRPTDQRGRRPVRAEVQGSGWRAKLSPDGAAVVLSPTAAPAVVTVHFE